MRGRKAKPDNVVPMRPDDPAEIREEVVARLIRRLQPRPHASLEIKRKNPLQGAGGSKVRSFRLETVRVARANFRKIRKLF
jgi:hypothetical protein